MYRAVVFLACVPLLGQPPATKIEPVTETIHGATRFVSGDSDTRVALCMPAK